MTPTGDKQYVDYAQARPVFNWRKFRAFGVVLVVALALVLVVVGLYFLHLSGLRGAAGDVYERYVSSRPNPSGNQLRFIQAAHEAMQSCDSTSVIDPSQEDWVTLLIGKGSGLPSVIADKACGLRERLSDVLSIASGPFGSLPLTKPRERPIAINPEHDSGLGTCIDLLNAATILLAQAVRDEEDAFAVEANEAVARSLEILAAGNSEYEARLASWGMLRVVLFYLTSDIDESLRLKLCKRAVGVCQSVADAQVRAVDYHLRAMSFEDLAYLSGTDWGTTDPDDYSKLWSSSGRLNEYYDDLASEFRALVASQGVPAHPTNAPEKSYTKAIQRYGGHISIDNLHRGVAFSVLCTKLCQEVIRNEGRLPLEIALENGVSERVNLPLNKSDFNLVWKHARHANIDMIE